MQGVPPELWIAYALRAAALAGAAGFRKVRAGSAAGLHAWSMPEFRLRRLRQLAARRVARAGRDDERGHPGDPCASAGNLAVFGIESVVWGDHARNGANV
jgi:hypothetical protein